MDVKNYHITNCLGNAHQYCLNLKVEAWQPRVQGQAAQHMRSKFARLPGDTLSKRKQNKAEINLKIQKRKVGMPMINMEEH